MVLTQELASRGGAIMDSDIAEIPGVSSSRKECSAGPDPISGRCCRRRRLPTLPAPIYHT